MKRRVISSLVAIAVVGTAPSSSVAQHDEDWQAYDGQSSSAATRPTTPCTGLAEVECNGSCMYDTVRQKCIMFTTFALAAPSGLASAMDAANGRPDTPPAEPATATAPSSLTQALAAVEPPATSPPPPLAPTSLSAALAAAGAGSRDASEDSTPQMAPSGLTSALQVTRENGDCEDFTRKLCVKVGRCTWRRSTDARTPAACLTNPYYPDHGLNACLNDGRQGDGKETYSTREVCCRASDVNTKACMKDKDGHGVTKGTSKSAKPEVTHDTPHHIFEKSTKAAKSSDTPHKLLHKASKSEHECEETSESTSKSGKSSKGGGKSSKGNKATKHTSASASGSKSGKSGSYSMSYGGKAGKSSAKCSKGTGGISIPRPIPTPMPQYSTSSTPEPIEPPTTPAPVTAGTTPAPTTSAPISDAPITPAPVEPIAGTASPTERPTVSPTLSPTPCARTEVEDSFDLCIAIDASGSVCGGPRECAQCKPAVFCRDYEVTVDDCCVNYRTVKDFSSSVISELDKFRVDKAFSVVQFSHDAAVETPLVPAIEAIEVLDEMVYTGGFTNHSDAILKCRDTLNAGDAGRKKFILLITDGLSTVPKPEPEVAAQQSADLAEADGMSIVPIFITDDFDAEAQEFMVGLSGGGTVLDVGDFDDLSEVLGSFVNEVTCSARTVTTGS